MKDFWKRTKELGISGIDTSNQGLFTVPNGYPMLAVNQVYKMLNWIHAEFIEDCSKNQTLFDPSQGMDTSRYEKQQEFIIRNVSRTLSYATQLMLLEGILRKEYENTILSLQTIDPDIKADSDALAQRKKEVAHIKTFRDKVAAHTAFSSPIPEDNFAQQLKSVIDLISTTFTEGWAPEGFGIGAIDILVNNEGPGKQYLISLAEIHSGANSHFEAWICMFESVLQRVQSKLPITIGTKTYKKD